MFARIYAVAFCLILTAASVGADQGSMPKDWRRVSSNGGPGPVGSHSMAYDSGSDRVLLFGGGDGYPTGNGYVWSFDFNADRWERRGPGGGGATVAAYDLESEVVILFPITRSYDFDTDTDRSMYPNPEPQTWHMTDFGPRPSYDFSMAYDAESDRVILFGGEADNYGCRLDTWGYDFNVNTWTLMSPNVTPWVYCPSLAYDSNSDRVILFGGWHHGDGKRLNETWAYDYNTDTWERRYPSRSPPARTGHAMVYDAQWKLVVVFGGEGDLPLGWLNDTWTYDYGADRWEELSLVHSPSRRWNHAMAYDSESNAIILTGGFANAQSINETWAFTATDAAAPSLGWPEGLPAVLLTVVVLLPMVLVGAVALIRRRERRDRSAGEAELWHPNQPR